ncbi:MAG: hypothetical protein ABFS28_06745 [Bacteroidota bacterium]
MNSELTIESFRELPVEEQQDIHGGIWPILVSLALIVVEEVVSDWDNFKNGLTGEPEEK